MTAHDMVISSVGSTQRTPMLEYKRVDAFLSSVLVCKDGITPAILSLPTTILQTKPVLALLHYVQWSICLE